MRDEESVARYLRRASELRSVADQTKEDSKRDGFIAAAEAYENLAAWNPAESVKRE
jgi:hypothetical protein